MTGPPVAGGRVLGMIPELNAVRIGFDNAAMGDEIGALLPDSAQIGFNFILAAPAPPDPTKQDVGGPYQAFDNHALAYFASLRTIRPGARVKVALLDTGVTSVPGLSGAIDQHARSGQPACRHPETLQHGTAMGSILAAIRPKRPASPAAHCSVSACSTPSGVGDSFTVAQGSSIRSTTARR